MNKLKIAYNLIPIKFRWKLNLIFILTFLASLVDLLSIGLIYPLLTVLFNPNEISFFGINFQTDKLFLEYSQKEIIIYSLVAFNLLIIFKNIFVFLVNYLRIRLFVNIQLRLIKSLYDNYMSKNHLFHIQTHSSTLVRNVLTETKLFLKKNVTLFIDFLSNSVVLIGLLIISLNVKFTETIIILSILIFFGFIYFSFLKRIFTQLGEKRIILDAKLYKFIRESLEGYREIKIYGVDKFFKENFLSKLFKRENVGKKISIFATVPKHLLEILIIVFFSIVIIFFLNNYNQNLTKVIPDIGIISVILIRLYPAVSKLIYDAQTLRISHPTIQLLHDQINNLKEYDIKDTKNDAIKINFNHHIEFKNVSFKYPKREQLIFENVNIKFEKGKTFGIIGQSGSGKSTFLDLLTSFINPTVGSISVDDVEILSQKVWMNKISYVSQNVFILDDTIKNNIIFGDTINFNENLFLESLKLSNSLDFINNLKDGYETIVGEDGSQLSGGQKQRINIARAIYKKSEIIIFDEATSALDKENENLIFNSIGNLMGKKTLFIVTHKGELIERCNIKLEIKDKTIKIYR